jgi:polysaccharide export outer membrane protein
VKQYNSFFSLIFLILILGACKSYKQDIMFKLDDNFDEGELSEVVQRAERNYVIQVNDILELDLSTNDGERIVDPNNELMRQTGGAQVRQQEEQYSYLVKIDGTIKFPIIGQVKIDSLTIDEAELMLQEKYNKYYKGPFVKLKYKNKRVIVLGAMGGQIIPLMDENISLVEVLAIAGGLDLGAKAQNIKVIRGNLANPEVYQINLSTVDGMRKSVLQIEPGDIIYVEPWRRPWVLAINDIAPLLSLLSSTLALVLVLQNL